MERTGGLKNRGGGEKKNIDLWESRPIKKKGAGLGVLLGAGGIQKKKQPKKKGSSACRVPG